MQHFFPSRQAPSTKALTLCSLLLTSLLSTTVTADIYSWIDAEGNRVYSDQKQQSQATTYTPQGDTNRLTQYKKAEPAEPATESTSQANTVIEALSSRNDNASSGDRGEEQDTEQLPTDPENMTEQQCQYTYGLSCERVIDWRKYALQACGDDERCRDNSYLERKYKPVSIAQSLKVAQRNGARRNMQEKRIQLFLLKKYTDYCAQQAQLLCSSPNNGMFGRSCVAQAESYCEDDRSLQEMLAKYDDLSIEQQKQVIAQAKQLTVNQPVEDIAEILGDIVDILLAQALL
jgi:hypothetical protein